MNPVQAQVNAAFQKEVLAQPGYKALLDFHSRHKYLLMAHSQPAYKQLGHLLATASDQPLTTVLHDYWRTFEQACSKSASRGNHCNTLQHMFGYLKNDLNRAEKADFLAQLERYQRGEISLAPLRELLYEKIRHSSHDYLKRQAYFDPCRETTP